MNPPQSQPQSSSTPEGIGSVAIAHISTAGKSNAAENTNPAGNNEVSSQEMRTVGSAKQAILQALRKHQSLSAQQLAQALPISIQAVRRHLKDLEADGAISHSIEHAKVGRPIHLYQLTAKGLEQFPKRYDEFALTFLQAMAERFGPEEIERVLQEQWHQKAVEYRRQIGEGSLGSRIEALAELRSHEGYMVDWHRQDSEQGEQYVFSEYNCAIGQVAEQFPSVCSHELEMLQAVFADGVVKRTHWMVGNEHRCGYLISET